MGFENPDSSNNVILISSHVVVLLMPFIPEVAENV